MIKPMLSGTHGDVVHDVITFDGQAPCLAASSFITVKDVPVADNLAGVAINILPVSASRTVAVFSCARQHQASVRTALDRVFEAVGDTQKYEMSKLVLSRISNVLFSPRPRRHLAAGEGREDRRGLRGDGEYPAGRRGRRGLHAVLGSSRRPPGASDGSPLAVDWRSAGRVPPSNLLAGSQRGTLHQDEFVGVLVVELDRADDVAPEVLDAHVDAVILEPEVFGFLAGPERPMGEPGPDLALPPTERSGAGSPIVRYAPRRNLGGRSRSS